MRFLYNRMAIFWMLVAQAFQIWSRLKWLPLYQLAYNPWQLKVKDFSFKILLICLVFSVETCSRFSLLFLIFLRGLLDNIAEISEENKVGNGSNCSKKRTAESSGFFRYHFWASNIFRLLVSSNLLFSLFWKLFFFQDRGKKFGF